MLLASAGTVLTILTDRPSMVRAICFTGAATLLAAIMHLTIANASYHARLQREVASDAISPEDMFGMAARDMPNLIMNSIQFRPAIGLYTLAAALLGAAILSQSQLIDRLSSLAILSSGSSTGLSNVLLPSGSADHFQERSMYACSGGVGRFLPCANCPKTHKQRARDSCLVCGKTIGIQLKCLRAPSAVLDPVMVL
jgi:hypothetical protein